jgi:aspartate carbamoyltransferase catalytic subunit
MWPDAMILRPLPRRAELDRTVDDDPGALYFRPATSGLYVRMVLLSMLLDGELKTQLAASN